jgi:hypothetical protein
VAHVRVCTTCLNCTLGKLHALRIQRRQTCRHFCLFCLKTCWKHRCDIRRCTMPLTKQLPISNLTITGLDPWIDLSTMLPCTAQRSIGRSSSTVAFSAQSALHLNASALRRSSIQCSLEPANAWSSSRRRCVIVHDLEVRKMQSSLVGRA